MSTLSDNVLAVVVLYNRPFMDVPCATRIRQWLAGSAKTRNGLKLSRCLIYDNSPVQQPLNHCLSESIEVVHDKSNGGTLAAYLHAIKMARFYGYTWILLVDHDTDLPQSYFFDADNALNSVLSKNSVCAVVPLVYDGINKISPAYITNYGRLFVFDDEPKPAYARGSLTAIASASLVKSDFLHKLLPIPSVFSLDYLDHWIFRELQQKGGRIAFSSARVEHSLSVNSMKLMSIPRYRSILAAELAFLRSGLQYSPQLHLFWHLCRTLKLLFLVRRPQLVVVNANAIINILRSK